MKEDSLKMIIENNLSIDCTSIKISKNIGTEAFIHEGPGVVCQEKDGSISFKIFCSGKLDPKVFFSQLNRFQPGKLIEDNEYFILKADALNGDLIEANSIIPHFNGGIDIDGYTVSGNCSKIFTYKDINSSSTKSTLFIYYNGQYKLPSNITRKTTTVIGDEIRGEKIGHCGSQFNVGIFDFEFIVEEDCTVVIVQFDSDDDPFVIAQRANESFQFITANNQHPFAIKFQQGGRETFVLFRQDPQSIKPRFMPPIPQRPIDNTGSFKNLFSSFFGFVNEYKETDWHPLFVLINNVIETSKVSIDAHALTLSVAIEGILKIGYNEWGATDSQTLEFIDSAKKLISTSDVDPSFMPRVLGAIDSMKHVRAKDKLIKLRDANVIGGNLYKAWEKLRNSSAHSAEIDFNKLQKYINNTYKICTLYYLLIFNIIGYKGEYIDYSVIGFPEKIL